MKTKKNSVRRSLIFSATALMISVAMLIGTTFAWFTDSVSSDNNKIVAGNLDITVDYLEGTKDSETWHPLEAEKNIFVKADTGLSNGEWEPGHTEIACLRVKNTGTLAAAYQAVVKVAKATPFVNQSGKTTTLDKYLKYDVLYYNDKDQFDADRNNLTRDEAVAKATIPLASFSSEKQTLMPEDIQYIMLIVTMPTDVGNEANAMTKDGNEASIDLTVQINGTQDAAEKDSFSGKHYDTKAYDDIETTVGTATVEGENESKTVTMTVGPKDTEGYTTATLTGTDIAASGKTAEDLRLVVHKESKPTVDAKDSCAYEPLNIVVENKAENATVTITRIIGAKKRGVTVYRGGNGMTKATSAEQVADGQYFYNAETGEVTFATNTFDDDSSKYDIEWTDKVTNIGELQEAINAGETDIKLAANSFELSGDLNLNLSNPVTISGDKNAVIYVEGQPKISGDITFEGITVKFNTTDTTDESGFQSTKNLTYISCYIKGKQTLYANTVTFTGCTLRQERFRDQTADPPHIEADYNVCINSAQSTTFEDCTFDSEGKAVYVDNDGIENTKNVVFNWCKFTASSSATGIAAIEINSTNMTATPGAKITIDDFTNTHVTGFGVGTSSGSSVWNDNGKNATVIVNHEVVQGTSTTPSSAS